MKLHVFGTKLKVKKLGIDLENKNGMLYVAFFCGCHGNEKRPFSPFFMIFSVFRYNCQNLTVHFLPKAVTVMRKQFNVTISVLKGLF